MKSKLFILASVVVAVGVMAFFIVNMKSSSESTDKSHSDDSGMHHDMEELDATGVYTVAQVAEHYTSSDCWTIIEGDVYDITEHIATHEGGDEILRACGIDGTTLFTQRRTSEGEIIGSGTSHSDQAMKQLEHHKIGTVTQ
jgi:cytochrome b involved in lipid metabolism